MTFIATPSWLTATHFPDASVLAYYVDLFDRAVAGDWRAQLEVGIRYAEGEVFPARFEEGGRWIAIAAESGEADALNAYAHWLCEGRDPRGVAILERLTREGDAFAPRNLAEHVEDRALSRSLRELAIARGNTSAMLELVDELANEGDMPAALAMCRRAAELGDADGASLLAEAYERGLGVEMDARASLRWHRRAVELARIAPGFGETR
jgi:TPR repeat protein